MLSLQTQFVFSTTAFQSVFNVSPCLNISYYRHLSWCYTLWCNISEVKCWGFNTRGISTLYSSTNVRSSRIDLLLSFRPRISFHMAGIYLSGIRFHFGKRISSGRNFKLGLIDIMSPMLALGRCINKDIWSSHHADLTDVSQENDVPRGTDLWYFLEEPNIKTHYVTPLCLSYKVTESKQYLSVQQHGVHRCPIHHELEWLVVQYIMSYFQPPRTYLGVNDISTSWLEDHTMLHVWGTVHMDSIYPQCSKALGANTLLGICKVKLHGTLP